MIAQAWWKLHTWMCAAGNVCTQMQEAGLLCCISCIYKLQLELLDVMSHGEAEIFHVRPIGLDLGWKYVINVICQGFANWWLSCDGVDTPEGKKVYFPATIFLDAVINSECKFVVVSKLMCWQCTLWKELCCSYQMHPNSEMSRNGYKCKKKKGRNEIQ